MSNEEWTKVSHIIDFVMQQPVKENPAVQGVRGEPAMKKKSKKPAKQKEEPPFQQQRMF